MPLKNDGVITPANYGPRTRYIFMCSRRVQQVDIYFTFQSVNAPATVHNKSLLWLRLRRRMEQTKFTALQVEDSAHIVYKPNRRRLMLSVFVYARIAQYPSVSFSQLRVCVFIWRWLESETRTSTRSRSTNMCAQHVCNIYEHLNRHKTPANTLV